MRPDPECRGAPGASRWPSPARANPVARLPARLTTLAGALLLAAGAAAQLPPSPAPPAPPALLAGQQTAERWYQVELIVFRYLEPIGLDGEQFPPAPVGDYRGAQVLITELPELADEPPAIAHAPVLPVAFQALTEDELGLKNAAAALQRNGNLAVLAHVGWRQPSYGSGLNQARRVLIRDPAAPPPEWALLPGMDAPAGERPLPGPGPQAEPVTGTGDPRAAPAPPVWEGTAQLRVGRYLDVGLDLTLYHDDDVPLRLIDSRRMRLGELHYVDHPLFGVLLQVVPFRVAGSPEPPPLPEEMEAVEAQDVEQVEEELPQD